MAEAKGIVIIFLCAIMRTNSRVQNMARFFAFKVKRVKAVSYSLYIPDSFLRRWKNCRGYERLFKPNRENGQLSYADRNGLPLQFYTDYIIIIGPAA
jgi:hypothetical protein